MMAQSMAILRLYHISAWDESFWRMGFHQLSGVEWKGLRLGQASQAPKHLM